MSAQSEQATNSDSGGDTERLSRRERIESRQRDISDGITDLENDAANEQVEALVGLLRQMDTELKRLEARNRQLTTRLKKVEAVNGLSGGEIDLGDVSALDHRDEKVVKAIVADGVNVVSLDDLRELYRGHTDVRDPETLKDRIKTLTATDLFKLKTHGLHSNTWRFVGLED
ncbi:hypothetical protein [Natrinema sp. DC36]|uniref:hypothetical protein n=1 Tax=Natrinema sp. DC36 TaxID=2878680 RepID=UPI001CEFEF97|nr:hypothetical protein [Natrinema sp. DC36]